MNMIVDPMSYTVNGIMLLSEYGRPDAVFVTDSVTRSTIQIDPATQNVDAEIFKLRAEWDAKAARVLAS